MQTVKTGSVDFPVQRHDGIVPKKNVCIYTYGIRLHLSYLQVNPSKNLQRTGHDRKKKQSYVHGSALCYTTFPNDFVLITLLLYIEDYWMSGINLFTSYPDHRKPGLGSSSRSSNSHPLISSALYSSSNLASSDSDSDGSRVLS